MTFCFTRFRDFQKKTPFSYTSLLFTLTRTVRLIISILLSRATIFLTSVANKRPQANFFLGNYKLSLVIREKKFKSYSVSTRMYVFSEQFTY